MSLPPPGIYGDTGINPEPKTQISPMHPVPNIPPSMAPTDVLKRAIRGMLGR